HDPQLPHPSTPTFTSTPLVSSLLLLSPTPRPPTPTLFPYTTLFRSRRRDRSPGAHRSAAGPRGELPGGELTMTGPATDPRGQARSEEHTSELQSRFDLVCRLLLEKKKTQQQNINHEENRARRHTRRT